MDLTNPFLAYAAVFFAGAVSSFSPCSLVTIPLIISCVGGYSEGNIKRAFILSLAFVIGLSLTFTFLGALASLTGGLLGDVGGYWKYILSAVAIIMGLQLLGILNLQFPTLSLRKPEQKGLVGALLLGMLFGIASSPCATPVLVIILTFVASRQNLFYGTSLLFVYALGYSTLVFLLGISTGLAEASLKIARLQGLSYYAHKLSGAVFVLIGIVVLFYLK